MEVQDSPDHKELLEPMEHLVELVLQETLVLRDHWVHQDCLDLQD